MNREILLGVGGGIASYKSADLIRRLRDQGFEVTVIPTQNSLNFVGVATWEALSGQPVLTDLWNNVHQVPHISFAKRAQAIVIAPATANLIAKVAAGIAHDFLTTLVLASPAPLIMVPAMHPEMWLNAATLANVALLRSRGVTVLEPDTGRLTGEDSGPGRYPTTARIVTEVSRALIGERDLSGVKILISAGGTREAIDPVRFIGNRSSGIQGYAIAEAASLRGAQVCVISANVALPDLVGVETVKVESATELDTAMKERATAYQVVVMCAAVADARPKSISPAKIPKAEYASIELVRNPDILQELTSNRRPNQIFIGFAAETEGDLADRGRAKMSAKGADLLYVNGVAAQRIFGEQETDGFIISADTVTSFSGSKMELASQLLDRVVAKLS